MPFKKKVLLTKKKLFVEPLIEEDKIDSDDNQDEIIKKLEEEYDVDHRSNIYVTGTLSLVFNKPSSENKIMNKTYYENFKKMKFQKKLQKINEFQKVFSRENFSEINSENYESARSIQPIIL